MTTSVTASIKPQFRMIDGVKIRYADSGGSQDTTPVTIINGRHDRVVPLANAEFLAERLPRSRLKVIDAGHFLWEERLAEYASIILDSIGAAG